MTRPAKSNDWNRDAKAGFAGVILFGNPESVFDCIGLKIAALVASKTTYQMLLSPFNFGT